MLQKDKSGAEVDIRHTAKADVQRVSEIDAECFSMPWSVAAFELEVEKPESITLVAVRENEIVGFVNGVLVLDEMYISNIAVTAARQRLGIGRMLLTALENEVGGTASFITLEVRRTNFSAQELYKKMGYSTVGIRKNFYEKPTEDAMLMTKIL